MVAATAVADLAAQALKEVASSKKRNPPRPLPPGWLLKVSRSHPSAYYYYNQDTGASTWDPPYSHVGDETEGTNEHLITQAEQKSLLESLSSNLLDGLPPVKVEPVNVASETDETASSSDRKRPHEDATSSPSSAIIDEINHSAEKKRKTANSSPSQVRVLHILKKHKDSRHPSSWRTNNKKITITREEAIDELRGLLDILREEEHNAENLIATFKELASQESDCSSAKRHGDLGMFGRKKMRPEFETAAFGLEINQLSDVVETASGAHILLRLE